MGTAQLDFIKSLFTTGHAAPPLGMGLGVAKHSTCAAGARALGSHHTRVHAHTQHIWEVTHISVLRLLVEGSSPQH